MTERAGLRERVAKAVAEVRNKGRAGVVTEQEYQDRFTDYIVAALATPDEPVAGLDVERLAVLREHIWRTDDGSASFPHPTSEAAVLILKALDPNP